MVAVPYSTGCRTCVQRRVKCDESRPGCLRCARRGAQCPGYQRALKFVPVYTPSKRGTTITAASRPPTTPASGPDQDTNQPGPIAKRPARSYKPKNQNHADELVVPNLTKKALASQGVEILEFFIDATLPGLYYSYSNRVAMNWMNFARRHVESPLDPLIWSIRCLGMLHLGMKYQDQNKIADSRAMYGRALQGLSLLLQRPQTARADSTLAIAVMLGVYEMLDGITRQSWLTHSSGIASIIRMRGPEAHRTGFGRTLLVSFKSFIVADALVRGKPCFLAEPAWRSVLAESITDESERGKGSWLGNLTEQMFMEISECPTLYARMRAMIAQPRDTTRAMCQILLEETGACRARLQRLRAELESGPPVGDTPEPTALIPLPVARRMREFALSGSGSAMALLDQIPVLIQSELRRRSMDPAASVLQPWSVPAAPLASSRAILDRETTLPNRLPVWPDQLALSMGMLAVKGSPPESECRQGPASSDASHV